MEAWTLLIVQLLCSRAFYTCQNPSRSRGEILRSSLALMLCRHFDNKIIYVTGQKLVVLDQGECWRERAEGTRRRSISVALLNSSLVKRCDQKPIPQHKTSAVVTRTNGPTAVYCMLRSISPISILTINPEYVKHVQTYASVPALYAVFFPLYCFRTGIH